MAFILRATYATKVHLTEDDNEADKICCEWRERVTARFIHTGVCKIQELFKDF